MTTKNISIYPKDLRGEFLRRGSWGNESLNKLIDREILKIPDSHEDVSMFSGFTVPKGFLSSPKIIIVWTSKANLGEVVLEVKYKAIGGIESLDPVVEDESPSRLFSITRTARDRIEMAVPLAENLSEDDEVQYELIRVNSDPNDTMMGEVDIFDILFEYEGA